jgi:hypothetical protein
MSVGDPPWRCGADSGDSGGRLSTPVFNSITRLEEGKCSVFEKSLMRLLGSRAFACSVIDAKGVEVGRKCIVETL